MKNLNITTDFTTKGEAVNHLMTIVPGIEQINYDDRIDYTDYKFEINVDKVIRATVKRSFKSENGCTVFNGNVAVPCYILKVYTYIRN